MNTARSGRKREHQVRDLFIGAGFTVIRAAASKGPCDLVAMRAEPLKILGDSPPRLQVVAINVKTAGDRWSHGDEHEAMVRLIPSGVVRLLVRWPKRRSAEWRVLRDDGVLAEVPEWIREIVEAEAP